MAGGRAVDSQQCEQNDDRIATDMPAACEVLEFSRVRPPAAVALAYFHLGDGAHAVEVVILRIQQLEYVVDNVEFHYRRRIGVLTRGYMPEVAYTLGGSYRVQKRQIPLAIEMIVGA